MHVSERYQKLERGGSRWEHLSGKLEVRQLTRQAEDLHSRPIVAFPSCFHDGATHSFSAELDKGGYSRCCLGGRDSTLLLIWSLNPGPFQGLVPGEGGEARVLRVCSRNPRHRRSTRRPGLLATFAPTQRSSPRSRQSGRDEEGGCQRRSGGSRRGRFARWVGGEGTSAAPCAWCVRVLEPAGAAGASCRGCGTSGFVYDWSQIGSVHAFYGTRTVPAQT